MILPTLVVGVLGVSHLGNDRTGNPFFGGQTVGLQGLQMRIKLVRASSTRCFTASVLALSLSCLRSGSVAWAFIVRRRNMDFKMNNFTNK